jgi:hypothetical protein
VPLTLAGEADGEGLPPAPAVDPVSVTPGEGAESEPPVAEDQDEILQRVEALQARGSSLRAIATQFNEEGVATLSGKGRWDSGTLSRLLRRSDRASQGSPPDGDLPPAA